MKTLFLTFMLFTGLLCAQELEFEVTTNLDGLSAANKEILANFGPFVQDYLNNNKFTGGSWDGDRIKCSMMIKLQSTSEQNAYTAQIFLTSKRPVYKSSRTSLMLKILDANWSFTYEKGQSFYFQPQVFNPLLSFLDFYAYLILGYDEDSYKSCNGSQYYKTAYDIALLGSANTQFQKGWEKNSSVYSRRGIVEDLLNEKFKTFRQDFFDYHYNGIDIYAQNKQAAQNAVVKLITNLESERKKADIKGVLTTTFFEAKSSEITECLKDYPDKEIFKTLKKIDPPHSAKYEEAMTNPAN
jgi:hypothetical protein